MTYTQQVWVNNSTPVDKAHMDVIENALATVPGVDQLVAAQQIKWAGDTNLYRSAAGQLKTDGTLNVVADLLARLGAAGQVAVGNQGPSNEAGLRFGSAADTNLYRSAAGTLKTDGALQTGGDITVRPGNAAGQVAISTPGGNAGIYFGSAGDTYIQRNGAASLLTNGQVVVGAAVVANNGTANQIMLHSNGHLYFSNAYDTHLYRGTAGRVTTDGEMQAGGFRSTTEGRNVLLDVKLWGSASWGAPAESLRINIDGNWYKIPIYSAA